MFHADNAYWMPAVHIASKRLKTNTVSNTAFRGFGGPQGMLAIEHVMDQIAWATGRDPLDVRYNVVNWVNRATRGWSYGNPVDDPRTGEIIKGAVMLGSLRARQDMLIFQALVGAGLSGTGD